MKKNNRLVGNTNLLKYLLVLAFTVIGTVFYWYIDERPMIGVDDANIYFVYMRNLAEGHGFVYNVGGERVEGFTSMLWTLIGAGFFLFTSSPELFLLLVNVIIISIALWRIVLFTDNFLGDKRLITPYSYFILGCILLIPGFFDWTILALMETGLWTLLLTSAVLNVCNFELKPKNIVRSNAQLTLLLVLMVLTRPESYLWDMIFLAIRCWQLFRWYNKAIIKTIKAIAVPLIGVFATIGSLTIWRLSYFGFLFPNTYYAKVSGDLFRNFKDGAIYDGMFLATFNSFCLIVTVLLVWNVKRILRYYEEEKRSVVIILLLVCLVTLLVPLQSGGDHFRYGRFIQPSLVFFYILFVLMAARYLKSEIRYRTAFIREISIALIALQFMPLYNITYSMLKHSPLQAEYTVATDGREFSKGMNLFFSKMKEKPTASTSAAGGAAYVYDGKVNDLMGLNNVMMAHADKIKSTETLKNHASFNKEVFYEQRPDLFYGVFCGRFMTDTTNYELPEEALDFETSFTNKIFKDIFDDPAFRLNYTPVFISIKGEDVYFLTYASRNFLTRMDKEYYSYREVPR